MAQITNRLRTSSAVVPTLIFLALCLASGTAGLTLAPTTTQWFFIALISLAVLTTCGQIIFFTIFDRDRLQNEEHLERKLALGYLKPQVGDASQTVQLDASSVLISNPSANGQSDA